MSRFSLSVLTVALAAFLGAQAALAAEGKQGKEGKRPPMDPEKIFAKLDANSDGSITKDEFNKGPFEKMDEERRKTVFGRMDANGDGKVSLDEFKTAHEKMKERHAKGGKGGGRKKGDK